MALKACLTPRSRNTSSAAKLRVSVFFTIKYAAKAYLLQGEHRMGQHGGTIQATFSYFVCAVTLKAYMFDEPAHPRFRDTSPTKYLHCIPSGFLCTRRGVALQESYLSIHFKQSVS